MKLKLINTKLYLYLSNQLHTTFLVSTLMLLFCGQLWAQFPQLGADIDGEAANDLSGCSTSLSANGKILAVGAYQNGSNAGHVRIYEWNGTAWVQKGTDIDGEAAGDNSGWSVGLNANGNIVAIGALLNDGNGVDAGHVRIYEWNGIAWVQKGNDIDGEAAGDNSGRSVRLNANGNIVAIGALLNDGIGLSAGHVRIYEWNGSVWLQKGTDIDGEAAGDNSGKSVSLNANGNILAIGASYNNGNGNYAGHVRIYEWNGTAWVQKGTDIDGEAAGDGSGNSVSLSANGNIVAIGAYANDANGYNAGHVRIYEWDGMTWVQKGGDIDGEAANDYFGWSISLSSNGNIVAIGAYNNDNNGVDAGNVSIYEWNGSLWVQRGSDIDGESPDDWSGYSVSLSDNGNIFAIGAIFNSGNGGQAGHVRVYKLQGIYGYSYQDFNQNCIKDSLEIGLSNRILILNPGNIILQTNDKGMWYLDSLSTGSYTLTADTSSPNWQLTCPVTQNFTITNPDSSIQAPSFGYLSNYPCSAPDISIHAPFLRPGFSNQKIYVKACNQSTASGTLNNGYVIVELDSLLIVESSSLPYTSIGNNQYRINVDSIYPSFCANFWLGCKLSTNAILGQTLCMNATLYPVDSCSLDNSPEPFPVGITPCSTSYDGSFLMINPVCVNDSIYFTITNGGDGGMSCFSQVRVYIDGQLFIIDSMQLLAGGSTTFAFAGDGRTWRLELDQHPLLNGNSHPSASIEACGNATNWTPNLVNILPQDDLDPNIDVFCGLVTGSYDPNDKTGYPLGLESTHDIVPNQELEYVIRFQNTGTDTAFTVVIRDTLSTDFDIFSVRSGVSSHAYSFKMYGPRVLEWTFNNIMLPDSNVNEVGSHGFIVLKVNQVADLPIGTILENSASIYFDYNLPIFTNTYFHTIDTLQNTISWAGQETLIDTACSEFSAHGFTYTQSGTYWLPIYKSGLDSLYTLDLTILNLHTTIVQESRTLKILNPDTTLFYQWLDCSNANTALQGETGISYTPASNGYYAVQITKVDCIDTSNCIYFSHPYPQNDLGIFVYPNPVTDKVNIAKGNNEKLLIRIFDNLGKLLVYKETQAATLEIDLYDFPAGIYYIHLCNGDKTVVQKIVRH